MTRKLKALGLALFAIGVIGAIGASAASAKLFHSTSTSGTTYITGTQIGATIQTHLANGTPTKCTTVVYDATYAGTTASDLTMTTTYSGCTAAGQKAEIKTNGCTDRITTPTEISPFGGDHFDAVVHLVCPAGKDVEVVVPTAGCTITMQPQTLGVVDLTNVTTALANQDDILLKWTGEYKYTTVGGGICGAGGTGKITGEVTLKAYDNATHTIQKDLWIA
jgi:hypothetical protein